MQNIQGCQVSRFGRETHIYLPLLTVSRRELLFSQISSWNSLFFQVKRLSDSKVVLIMIFNAGHIPFHCIVCDNHLPRHVAQFSETKAGAWYEIKCIFLSVFLVSR